MSEPPKPPAGKPPSKLAGRSPRPSKDPARPTRAKASRETLPPIAPALESLLNPGIARGEAGIGSQTGLDRPAGRGAGPERKRPPGARVDAPAQK